MVLYCRRTNPFTVEEVLQILNLPDYQKIITDPPCKPHGGDVFLFSFSGSPQKRNDWRCDQYSWSSCGVRLWPKRDPKLRKCYHKLKSGSTTSQFIRHGYSLLDPSSEIVLVHYLGDEKGFQQLPHGNRKKNLTRLHVRTMPSIIQKIAETNARPSKTYQDLCNKPMTESALMPVAQPRNLEQIRNKLKLERQRTRISHDDFFSVLELIELLEGFIHDFSLHPTMIVIMGLQDISSEIGKVISLKTDLPMLFSYDTTFQLGDFYLSTILFQNVLFTDSPLTPVMFMMHDSRREDSHRRFFEVLSRQCPFFDSEKVIIVSDREKGIEKAMDRVLVRTQRVVCWNHIRRDVMFWLKKHGANSGDTKVYLADLFDLLRSNSEEDYAVKLKKLSRKWSKAFLDYFEDELHRTIITHAGAWILQRLNIYNEKSGITTNISESFHAALKRLSQWKEMTIEAMLLSLYAMQNFYLRETLRGLCNTGNLHLRPQFIRHSRTPEHTVFPHIACDPSEIMDLVQRGELPRPKKDESYEKEPSVCQVLLADVTVQNNLIGVCPRLGVFVVRGSKEQNYVVRLFPKESCSCPSSRTCYHILAAKKSIGMPAIPGKPRRLQLTQLKRNRRQKTRSGRKFPRLQGKVDISPALDSVQAAEKDESPISDHLLTLTHMESTQPLMTSTPKTGKSLDSGPLFFTPSERVFDKSQIIEEAPPWHNCTFSSLRLQNKGLVGLVANICVYDYDIDTLRGANWLNDRIIDAFLASRAIMAKEMGQDGTIFPLSCHFMQTLISQRLSAQTLKYCLKYGVLRKDVLIIPVNDRDVHWILIVVIFKRKTMLYLDSKHGLNHSVINAITSFLAVLYEKDSKCAYSFADWSFYAPTDIPWQENSSDCGPFTCTIAHVIASATQFQFTQKDMAAIRPWIAKEIIVYSGKTYLERRDNYIPLEIASVPPKKRHILKESGITVSRSCPEGWNNTLTFCSKILPSLFEGRWSQCFLKEGCMKPSSDLTMVLCEGNCKDWYHCFCVGVDSKALPRVFICPTCQSTVARETLK